MKIIRVKKGDADIGSILDKLAKSAQVFENSSNGNWNKLDKQRDTFKKIQDFINEKDKDQCQRLRARISDAIGQTTAFLNDLKKYEDEVGYILGDL